MFSRAQPNQEAIFHMNYNDLPHCMINKGQYGDVWMPTKRHYVLKFVGVALLILSLSIIVQMVSDNAPSLFAMVFSGCLVLSGVLLLNIESFFVFSLNNNQLMRVTRIFRRSMVKRFFKDCSNLKCDLSKIETQNVYQIKMIKHKWHFDSLDEALSLCSYLSLKHNVRVMETISKPPSETMFCEDTLRRKLSGQHKNPRFVEIWDKISFAKLTIPFFVFTLLAGVMKL